MKFLLLCALLIICNKKAFAGAWLQKEGAVQMINQAFLTHSDLSSRKYDGKEEDAELETGSHNLYAEYGFKKD